MKRQLGYITLAWTVGAIAAGVWARRPGATLALLAVAALGGAVYFIYRALATWRGEAAIPDWAYERAQTDTSDLADDRTRLLRALKDLEYERDVGRISPDDFETQKGAYQTQLVSVMASLDRKLEPFVRRAEREIAEHRNKGASASTADHAVASAPSAPSAPAAPEPAPSPASKAAPAESAREKCPSCGAAIPQESVFCKKCGARLAPMICPDCRTSNDPDSVFCKKCGKRLAEPAHA